jgi:outer membrane biosynthesis protein TonB
VTGPANKCSPKHNYGPASRLLGVALVATVAVAAVGCRKIVDKLRGEEAEPAVVEAEPPAVVPAEAPQAQPVAQQPTPGQDPTVEPAPQSPSAPAPTATPSPAPRAGTPGERALVPSPQPTSDQRRADPAPQPSNPPSTGDGQRRSLDLDGRVRRARTRTETPTGDVGDKRVRRQD